MIKSWTRLAARIDALSLRERAFLFLSLVAVCIALVDTLWVSPAQLAYRQVSQTFARQNAELQRLREDLKANASRPDAARDARAELDQLKASIAAANQEIAAVAGSSKGGMTLPEVMVHFLRRHAGLTLVHTGNLGSEASVVGAPGPVLPPLANAAPGLMREGLELTVSGPYPELVRYVQTLETAMPDLRWGALKLTAAQQPPELGLQVFVVRQQP